jgi:hypothetical protein
MLSERPLVEKSLEAIFHHEGLTVRRIPQKHAGGKWQLKYPSVLVGNGNLEVDVNFMFRIPLGEVVKKRSHRIGAQQTQEVSVLDILAECQKGLSRILPLRDSEREFFDRLLDHGEIKASLLTTNAEMADFINSHPLIQWKSKLAIQNKDK